MPGIADEYTLPIEWLRERYRYNARTGVITLRSGPSKLKPLGSINKDGYRVIKVPFSGRRIQIAAHRLAWALHHGWHPVNDVDHKDLRRDNNRMKNLRHATRSQNLANRPNTGAFPKGVTKSRSKSKPFQAQITVNKCYRYLGCFDTPEAAHAAYLAHAEPAFGEFMRVA